MTTEELREFVVRNIRTFSKVRIVGEGRAYHYSPHTSLIGATNKFFGAPIDENLDKTQESLRSKPATANPGVVFAYERAEDAAEEGFGCDLFQLDFFSALAVSHNQEVELGGPDTTLLILNTEIERFALIGPCDDISNV